VNMERTPGVPSGRSNWDHSDSCGQGKRCHGGRRRECRRKCRRDQITEAVHLTRNKLGVVCTSIRSLKREESEYEKSKENNKYGMATCRAQLFGRNLPLMEKCGFWQRWI